MNYYLMNSAVIPAGEESDGVYFRKTIDKETAVKWLRTKRFESRIGYESTQEFIHLISDVYVPLSRESTSFSLDDEALVVRLNYRIVNPADKGMYQPRDEDFVFELLQRVK